MLKKISIKIFSLIFSTFICASYFVSARIVDQFAMGVFNTGYKDESWALLASDIFVWLAPLIVFELYRRFISSKE